MKLNKIVLVGLKNGVHHEFSFDELEIARFFTHVDEKKYIHGVAMDGEKVTINPYYIATIVVKDENGNIEFDSDKNDIDANIEIDDNFNFNEFVDVLAEVENDLDKFDKLAEVIEKKYPFIKVSTDFDVDDEQLEEFIANFVEVD